MRFSFILIGMMFFSAVDGISKADVPVTQMRRLYDFTPVSASNPILVTIKTYGIGIPISEARAYFSSEFPENPIQKMSPAEKRRHLDELIDDHLFLWEGYQEKANQTPGLIRLLRNTQALLMQETLTQMEVGSKAKNQDDYQRLSKQLLDQTFDKAEVIVSNEAYDQLKATVKRLNLALAPAISPGAKPKLDSLAPEVQDRSLAKCKLGMITIGDFLTAYLRIPPSQRPDIQTQNGTVDMLKRMLEDDLLIEEARERGLDKAPIVMEKLQLNLNIQTRLYALDQITKKTVNDMKSPGHEAQLKQWYKDHVADLYTYKDDKGQIQVETYDSIRDRIENDYFDAMNEQNRAKLIQSLRQGQTVDINEKLYESL